MGNRLEEAANQYRKKGYSIVFINSVKKAIHKWKQHNRLVISENKLHRMLALPECFGIAVICGCISGNLEVIDIDEKNNRNGKAILDRFLCSLDRYSPELVAKLVIARTKNYGFHLMYKSKDVQSSTILARRLETNKGLCIEKRKLKTLVESIGNESYIIVEPTPGYSFVQHDLMNVPNISERDRLEIWRIARSFNEYKAPSKISACKLRGRQYNIESPCDDYNLRGDILGLLQKHGWVIVKTEKERTFLRRPGDTDHLTSGDFHHKLGLFTVMTTNSEFKRKKGYKPYAVFAILECNGNFQLAARMLVEQGYGVAYKARIKS
ncbi:bifunctional DNA primase/polymerase [Paraflavitalea sp. CAU 1676]|uniref:bifunctional DNA primase/polymerase n=1 Tax=Paraflavitalea sp. CAU 1676 TaxID=3032598 RepID=UPI0023DC07F1|nr:bifunctional DNA primase/polymerase [Paraflavitalea sp. CAU 1676]MDF2190491.1 bifunctional DNA primase/polymerase [Paraflavitalea sp. CAU 1676]